MRAILIALSIIIGINVAGAEDLPTKDCPASFLTRWRADKEKALSDMPRQPCWMRTGTGPYVCNKDGCVRAHVYFSGD